MKHKYTIYAIAITTLTAIPLAPANAKGYHSHGGHNQGLFFGLFAAGVTGAALALAADHHPVIVPPPPPRYVYATSAPVYYTYEPIYRHRDVMVYHSPAPYYPHYTYIYR